MQVTVNISLKINFNHLDTHAIYLFCQQVQFHQRLYLRKLKHTLLFHQQSIAWYYLYNKNVN